MAILMDCNENPIEVSDAGADEIFRLRAQVKVLRAGLINIRDRFNAFAATDTPLQHRYDQLANAIAAALREGE
jgi:hypothetical protein